MQLKGIHHLSAITADARANLRFYTQSLGMRLVKKTVNQDDTSAYHLFYADGVGSPGSDLTFFEYPSRPERRGTRSIVRTSLRVADAASLEYWEKRLRELNLKNNPIRALAGRQTLDFDDAEGHRYRLVVDDRPAAAHPWEKSPVPPEHQIRGLGPITISVPELESTDRVLTNVMNLRKTQEYGDRASDGSAGESTVHIYEMGDGGAHAELHVAVEPKLHPASPGAGGVHHVAFRIRTFAEYDLWTQRLNDMRIASSGPVNRFYFRSLYFREPNGVLFELATDEPGFAADEPLETLGQRLALPPFLEPRRAGIEAGLHPLEQASE